MIVAEAYNKANFRAGCDSPPAVKRRDVGRPAAGAESVRIRADGIVGQRSHFRQFATRLTFFVA